MYNNLILDHFYNPRNAGVFSEAEDIGTGLAGGQGNTSVVQIQIRVNHHKIITEARFKTFGCVSSIAASSWATERLKDLSLEDAKAITSAEIATALALPLDRTYCALLVEDAIKLAINSMPHAVYFS